MLYTSHRDASGEPGPADAPVPVSPVITLAGVSKRFQHTVALDNVSADHPARPVRRRHRPLRGRQDHAAALPVARDDGDRRAASASARAISHHCTARRCARIARGSA